MVPAYIHEEDRGGIGVLRLYRPPANAIDLDVARELAALATSLSTSKFRAIVLTGSGTCFSAGADLKRVPTYGPEQQREMVQAINRLVAGFYACEVPVVAAINGHALGGGLIVAMCADHRVCTAAACKLGLTEARAGIPFPAATLAVLCAELSPAVARRLTLRALSLDPQTALEWGVVDEVVPQERVVDRAVEVALDLAGIPREAYRRIKLQLRADAIKKARDAAESDRDPMLEEWLGAGTAAAAAATLTRT